MMVSDLYIQTKKINLQSENALERCRFFVCIQAHSVIPFEYYISILEKIQRVFNEVGRVHTSNQEIF